MSGQARARSLLSVALVAASCLAACGGALEAPPVELSYRESMVGAGKIVQIQNTSDQPLTDLVVTLTSPDGDSRTFNHSNLAGFERLEIGWKKLGGWEIPTGAEVRVEGEGYLLAFEGQLADEVAEE